MRLQSFLLSIFLAVDAKDIFDKFWHFLVVGGGGFFIDVGITYFLLRVLKLHKYLSNSIGFLCGLSFNYYFNRTWTFKSDDPNIMVQYIKFAVIGIIGLLIVNGMIYLLHTKNKMPFFWAKVLAMVVFMFWNFSANYFYTFT